MKIISKVSWTLSLWLLLLTAQVLMAQTFRGGISGTVTDASGAVVPNAKLTLLANDTEATHNSVTTGAGDFAFQDLPLGADTLTVDAPGFAQSKVADIMVRPGQVFSLVVKMTVAAASQEVQVNAAAITVDTQSATNSAVVNDQAVQNIPLNGRDFTQLIKTAPGYNGAGSINGTRTNQDNWQIDGADNNDLWQNTDAANQGGVGGIAGVLIPVEAIDQFSLQTQGNAEIGRNGGGLISLAIKSGTNSLHGSAYYFNRNELFAAKSPFLPSTTRKPELRNQQFGGSVGGPIVKNKFFYFMDYERQMYVIQNQAFATEPTGAYATAAENPPSSKRCSGESAFPQRTVLVAICQPERRAGDVAKLLRLSARRKVIATTRSSSSTTHYRQNKVFPYAASSVWGNSMRRSGPTFTTTIINARTIRKTTRRSTISPSPATSQTNCSSAMESSTRPSTIPTMAITYPRLAWLTGSPVRCWAVRRPSPSMADRRYRTHPAGGPRDITYHFTDTAT